jgi:hypothetical protein
VQPKVEEISGNIFGIGPANRVGEDERDIVPPQQATKTGSRKLGCRISIAWRSGPPASHADSLEIASLRSR